MALTFLKHRWQKITLIIVGVLAVLVLIPVLFLNSFLAPKLSAKLKSTVLEGTDSLYRIDFSDADIEVLQGKAVLYDIKFKPDTAVYHRMKKLGKAPNTLYELTVKRLVISNAHPFALYFKKKLDIGRITLNTPEIKLSKYADKPDTTKKDKRTLYQKISKSLKLVHVGGIYLTDINFKNIDYTGKKAAVSELKKMNLTATDLLIDSATQTDTTRFLFCKDITTELYNYSSKDAKGLYAFRVKSVKLSTQTAKLTVTGLNLQPVSTGAFFAKSTSDRFTVRMDTIQLNNFDYMNYQKNQDIDISKAVITKGFFEVHSNPNGKPQTTDRLVTFPHWALRNAVDARFNIDTLVLKRMSVTYKQLNKKPMKTGSVIFTNTNARFLNLTNKPELLKKNNICTVNLTSYFMGKGKLTLGFIFNLSDVNYNYSYKGHLAPMDIAAANPAIMPLSLVKVTSGRVKSLDFNVHSTQKMSTGKVTLLYNDLNVDVLRADYSKNTLISLAANSLILKHDNPDDGSTTPRVANVVFIRPANFPFFKTVWLTILNGIKACAGVGEAQEKKFQKQITEQDKKEQEKMVKEAKKKKEEEDKKFKEKLKEQAKAKKKKDN